jgi:signal transduction histidine kinase
MAMGLNGDATREMRTLLFELRDGALESEGLAHALEMYVDLVGRHSDLRIELRIACELDLPAPYRVNLYHLVQEGLMNVVKHARAHHASIILSADRGAIRLRLEDDGIGFASTDPAFESGGLLLLRERVSELGGTLRLGSRPQGGAYLDAALPLREEPS